VGGTRTCSTGSAAPSYIRTSSSLQVFVIGLAAERAVELAGVSTGYRNSEDHFRNSIVMDVELEDHMGEHASNSNLLTEEPRCRREHCQ